MSYVVRIVATFCIAILVIASARAAVFDSKLADGFTALHLSGEIIDGDADRFKQVVLSISGPTIVVLNSNGGNVVQALMIGEAIRSHGYATAVTNGSECASACGLIWLAGRSRYAGRSAQIGFHAAYTGSGDGVRENGMANAMVGVYLNRLGLSYAAVIFATSAAPDNIRWLTPEDAQKTGIQYISLPDPAPEQPRQAPAATVAQALPDGSPLERRMMNLVLSYYSIWSRPGTDVDGLTQYYGDTVTFYGSSVTRSKVLDEKGRFSARWPVRHYTVKTSTLFVQCADTCSVSGVVEWDVGSVERNAHSVGAANFVLRIVPVGSDTGGVILSENGSVLSSHTNTLSSVPQASADTPVPLSSNPAMRPAGSDTNSLGQQAASMTSAYAEGRRARIDYERWFASLPDGSYRDGVVFWAGNRSLKVPPACAQPGSVEQRQLGCNDARARLTIIDTRRRAEKDYWSGWNSL